MNLNNSAHPEPKFLSFKSCPSLELEFLAMVRFVSFVTRFIAAIIKIIKCEAERLSIFQMSVANFLQPMTQIHFYWCQVISSTGHFIICHSSFISWENFLPAHFNVISSHSINQSGQLSSGNFVMQNSLFVQFINCSFHQQIFCEYAVSKPFSNFGSILEICQMCAVTTNSVTIVAS